MKEIFRFGCLIASVCLFRVTEASEAFSISGKSWMDYGRLQNVSDTLLSGGGTLDLEGNALFSLGAQFTAQSSFNDHWEGVLGFGAQRVNHSMGNGQAAFLTIALFQNFLTESRLTWFQGDRLNPSWLASMGAISYQYNKDSHNFGSYLFRGPIYPAILMGGFQDPDLDPTRSTIIGAQLHQSTELFSNDIILNCERDIAPTLDFSLGYVGNLRPGKILELGVGFNLYRLIPYNTKMNIPGKLDTAASGIGRYIEINPNDIRDTTFFQHSGIKVMGTAAIDLKPIFSSASFQGNEMKLYSEAAIIGVKNYGTIYGKMSERIPVMVGFNFPTFGFLNRLSLEVEYFGSPYRSDLNNLGNMNQVADWTLLPKRPIPSPKPVLNSDYKIDSNGVWVNGIGDSVLTNGTGLAREKVSTDDIKWSLLFEKTFSSHFTFIAQIANDHYRPKPVATGLISSNGGTAEAFSEKQNWYFMTRIGFSY